MNSFFKSITFLVFLLTAVIGRTYSNCTETLLANLDLSGFNERQKEVVKEEITAYGNQITPLYHSNREEYKQKINEMLYALRDGFRVYRLARDPSLESKIRSFDSTAKAKVYLLSYVEDAFLNHLFLRLAEAYYEITRPDRNVVFRYKFKKTPQYTYENPMFEPVQPIIELAKPLEEKFKKVLLDLTTTCYQSLRSEDGKGYDIHGQSPVFQQHFFNSVNDGLNWLLEADIKDAPNLGPVDCRRFCNMNGAERCAFILEDMIDDYGDGEYIEVVAGKLYRFKAIIELDDNNDMVIEKEFTNDPAFFKEYAEYLRAWGVDYLYRGIIEMNYPATKWEDYIPWGDGNNCKDHCISFSFKSPPPTVKFITDVLTSTYVAPGKIVYGRNFIFEEEEVSRLDRGLAFLDVPGIGVVTKTVAVKLGIKAVLVGGIIKTLNTSGVLDDIIKKSGVSIAEATLARNAINSLPEAKKVFIFNALTRKLIQVEEISEFSKVVGKSDTWDEVVVGWKMFGKTNFKVGDKIAGISIKQIKKGTNGKFAVIGRSMGNSQVTGIRAVYEELKNIENLDIEIFDGPILIGSWKEEFESALIEFSSKTKNWTMLLSNQELMQLKMYKLNKLWAQKLLSEGYTIIDMGDFNNLGFSVFYSMEKSIIFKK